MENFSVMPIDYSKYHPKWKLISKFIRFYRAKNKCEGSPKYPNCRAENYMPHPVTMSKVVLTVAHLDHDINNNSFFNLKAMCNRCHLTYDAKHHAENRRKKKFKNQYKLEF